MTLTYDRHADAVYIRLRDVPYAFGDNLDDERRIDYGADQLPLGIELLGVSYGVNLEDLPEQEAVGRLLAEHHIKVFA